MAEFVTDMKKTHSCGELRGSDLGSQVVLMGWVHSHRNLGGCVFVDLRDRYGITQIKVDPTEHPIAFNTATTVRPEWVIGVQGAVLSRGANVNLKIPTSAPSR